MPLDDTILLLMSDLPRRLPTSQEIYARIRWDPGLCADWITIVYEDRERGLQEITFAAFQPDGDIPWHRVRRFRCGDTVVWDRQAQTVDLASIRRAPSPPSASPPPCPMGSEAALLRHLRDRKPAWVVARAAPDYPSFIEEAVLHLRADGAATLSVEWRSYAMDWMGDATHVQVIYAFPSLAAALAEIHNQYRRDPAQLLPGPPPLPDGSPLLGAPPALVALFQDAWRRLRADFAADRLLFPGLPIAYRFNGW